MRARLITLLRLLDDIITRLGIPTQSCVLTHVTTTLRLIGQGLPVDLVFQSIAGTEAANIRRGAAAMGLRDTGWTAHSPRVGFATGMFLKRGVVAIPEIRHVCRWQSEKSLKVYLDVVGAAASRHSQQLELHAPVADAAAKFALSEILAALAALEDGSSPVKKVVPALQRPKVQASSASRPAAASSSSLLRAAPTP